MVGRLYIDNHPRGEIAFFTDVHILPRQRRRVDHATGFLLERVEWSWEMTERTAGGIEIYWCTYRQLGEFDIEWEFFIQYDPVSRTYVLPDGNPVSESWCPNQPYTRFLGLRRLDACFFHHRKQQAAEPAGRDWDDDLTI